METYASLTRFYVYRGLMPSGVSVLMHVCGEIALMNRSHSF